MKRQWTRETAITALQAWAREHGGRAPRQHELGRHADPPLPSTHHLKEWGGLRQIVIAAGLPAAPLGSGARKPRQIKGFDLEQPAVVEPVASNGPPPTDTEVTVLERLVQDLKEAERVLALHRDPYIKARDDVQLLRLEMIELLQKEDPS